jgi:hypothetical protein
LPGLGAPIRLVAPCGIAAPRGRRGVIWPAARWIAGAALAAALAGAYFVASIQRPPATADVVEADDARQPDWIRVTGVPFEFVGADPEQA